MAPERQIIAVTADSGELVAMEWLEKAECVHRQLRPQLPAEYTRRMSEVFGNGARMAVVVEAGRVLCVTVWRLIENTYEGRRLYVDDLITDESVRSSGSGKLMLDWLAAKAASLDCDVLALDSGVQRQRAHQFYFREGMHIPSFSFKKVLK